MAKDKDNTQSDKALIGRLWRDYVRKHLGTLLLAVVFMAILAATQAGYVYLLKEAGNFLEAMGSDQDASNKTLSVAFAIGPVILGLTAAAGISMYVQAILSNKIALSVIRDLQVDMFSSVQRADYALFTRDGTGNLVSRFINDVTILTNALLRTITNIGRDTLTVFAVLGMMFYTDWMLTLMIFGILLIVILPLISLSRTLRGNSTDAQSQVGEITNELTESFAGARLVKSYGLEEKQDKRLFASFSKRLQLYLRLVTNQARVDPMMEIIGGIAIVSLIIVGVWRVASSDVTGFDVVAILGGLAILTPRIRALGTLNNVIQEGLAALTRMFELIDERPSITDKPNAETLAKPKSAITFDDVSFAYEDGTQALSNISFTAKPGEMVALVGPSGGGKSTLLNMLPRLYDVSEGTITIGKQDLRDVKLEDLRGAMALVSQDVTLFNDSVAANIAMGREGASRDEIEAAAKHAAAHEFISSMAGGYDAPVGPGGSNLSGGQRQRIAIARALLRDVPILLLDEATSALDAQSEAKVQKALDKLSKGRTTFVIAHRLSTVRNADKIIVLSEGKIVQTGTHESLMKDKKGIYAGLAALQFSE